MLAFDGKSWCLIMFNGKCWCVKRNISIWSGQCWCLMMFGGEYEYGMLEINVTV